MSLFQAREWWTHKPDQPEECSGGALVVANIDNDPRGGQKVVTGTFQGYLRIYTPKQAGYKVEDLMEFQLDEPILQIEAGRFVNQGNKLSLAVLHPRKLVVYNVVAIGANGKMVAGSTGTGGAAAEQTSYYDLNKAYEHRLERTAYNFCYGPFGGVYGKDFICVQSMDGQLSFMEQENFAFSRFLSNFLLPGPLAYIAKIDSFVTCNSSMDVECYKYHVLGSSHGAEKKLDEPEADLSGGNPVAAAMMAGDASVNPGAAAGAKRMQPDWKINLGEHVHSLFVARYSRSLAASQVDILVLGEHTLFTLKENGTIRLQKRLDYDPSACVAYNSSPEEPGDKDVGGANQNLIITTHQSSAMVYKDMQLIWAARTQSIPVAVQVASFAGIKGMLVLLNDAAELQVCYLGTDPPITGVNAADGAKELDYEAMDEEHRALLKVIKQASTDSMVEPKEKLTLRAQVSQSVSTSAGGEGGDVYTESSLPKGSKPDEEVCVRDDRSGNLISVLVRLYLNYNGRADLENISITLDYSPAFRCSAGKTLLIPALRGGTQTPTVITLRFRAVRNVLPADLELLVLAAYVTPNNEPRTARLDTRLPLSLAARVVSPLKNCQYMFTLDTNRSPPTLNELFPDVLDPVMANNAEVARTAANVMTLMCHVPQADVTILVSKKSGRYRLQSSMFEALALVTDELVLRLERFYAAQDAAAPSGEPVFQCLFLEQLPLHDYFLLIDRHFEVRQKLSSVRGRLERLAHQFRVIQKRLLVRYKDKNPAPLLQFDTLMQETYTQLGEAGEEQAALQSSLREVSNQLACSTRLMLQLIRFKFDLDGPNYAQLLAHLTPSVSSFDGAAAGEIGWEEVIDSGCTSLLRGALAKGGPPPIGAMAPPMEPLQEVAKLKRHIQIVCDRLGKGMRIVPKEKAAAATAKGATAPAGAAPAGAGARPPVPQQPAAPAPRPIQPPQQQQQAAPPQRRQQQRDEQEVLAEEEEEEVEVDEDQ